MHTSALYELFQSLSAWQLRHARYWVESPAFNRRTSLLRLFDYLLNCRNTEKTPEYNGAIAIVFAQDSGSLVQLRHEMSALAEVLRKFLIWEEMEAIGGQTAWLLLRATRKLGLEKNFQLATKEAEKSLPEQQNRTSEQQLLAFRHRQELFQWEEKQKRDHELTIAPLQSELDVWYAGQSLQLACMAQSRKNVRSAELNTPELEQILDLLPGQPHLNIPSVAIYHLGRRMLAEPENNQHMEAYQALLSQHLQAAPITEGRDLLMLAINHGIRRINVGDREAIRLTLNFYLLGLEKKVLHDEQGYLSKYTYNHVLMSFLALEEWVQAAAFLERYRLELPQKEQDNIYRYNLAIYHFRRNEYDAALELLRDVTFPDPMYKLESRKMLLKIYFEQEATQALESLLESLLVWLRRHGEIGYHREMYRNLARFTIQLLRLPPGNTDARKRLAKKIKDTPLVAERSWLLSKV